MILLLALTTMMLGGISQPALLDGDTGLYTTRASFRKPGEVLLNVRTSIGTMKDTQTTESLLSNQFSGNLQYAPLSRLIVGLGGTLYSIEDDAYRGLYANIKFPLLRIGRITSSMAPSVTYSNTDNTYFGGAIHIDIVPFSSNQLPPLIFANSFSLSRCDHVPVYQLSSLLTFHSGAFVPFIEFYTDYREKINIESSYNSRLSSGLGFSSRPWSFRAAVEIPLNEPSKRDFDFRFSGEIAMLFSVKRTPRATVTVLVHDAQTNEPLDATINLKGKDVQTTYQCAGGGCTIASLIAGLYTLEVQHPGYKSVKAPLFVKDRAIEKVFKLAKLQEEKGGD